MGTLEGRWFRRLGALYLLAFFVAAVAAPHRHINSLEDILSDEPSDSGIVVEGAGSGFNRDTELGAARLIDDDPCLACFPHDYAAAATRLSSFTESFRPLPWVPRPPTRSPLGPLAEFRASRSPPISS